MKEFKDFTIEDFTSHIDMSESNTRPIGKVSHIGLFRRINKEAFGNDNVTTGYITEEIMNVPTVTIQR